MAFSSCVMSVLGGRTICYVTDERNKATVKERRLSIPSLGDIKDIKVTEGFNLLPNEGSLR